MIRPRIRKRKRDDNHAESAPESPVPADYSHVLFETPKKRLRVVKAKPTFFVGNGNRYIQRPNLLIPRGQVGMLERPLNWTKMPLILSPERASEVNEAEMTDLLTVPSLHHRKREAQNQRWIKEVIPKILGPYMRLLRTTENLSADPVEHHRSCSCMNTDTRVLSIVIVRMYSMYYLIHHLTLTEKITDLERIELSICACRTAAVQLIDRGLFPCAPLHPSLAVDIRVLDFVTRYFLRASPNHTAWAHTANDFLRDRGYQLNGGEVSYTINLISIQSNRQCLGCSPKAFFTGASMV